MIGAPHYTIHVGHPKDWSPQQVRSAVLGLAETHALPITVTQGHGYTPIWGYEQSTVITIYNGHPEHVKTYAGDLCEALDQDCVLMIEHPPVELVEVWRESRNSVICGLRSTEIEVL